MWVLIPHSEILAPDFCYKNVVANRFMITTDVRSEIYIRRMWKATYTVAKQHHHPRVFLVHGNLSSCSWSGPLPRKLLTGRGDNETILSAHAVADACHCSASLGPSWLTEPINAGDKPGCGFVRVI